MFPPLYFHNRYFPGRYWPPDPESEIEEGWMIVTPPANTWVIIVPPGEDE